MENSSPSQTSPGSATASAPKGFAVLPTIGVGLGLAFIFIFLSIVSVAFFVMTHAKSMDPYAIQQSAQELKRATLGIFGLSVQAVCEIGLIVFLLAVLPPLAKTSLRGLGFRGLRMSDVAIALYGAIAMFVVVNLFATALSKLFHDKSQEAAIQVFFNLHTPAQKFVFLFFGSVLAPFAEELTFRIFLFNALRAWWTFWPGAVVSSLIFGFVHFQGGGWTGLIVLAVPLTLAGLILCTVYTRTTNAWASMITHGLTNGVTIALLWVAPQLTH